MLSTANSLIYSGKAPAASQKFALSTEELKILLPKIRDKGPLSWLKVSLVYAYAILQF